MDGKKYYSDLEGQFTISDVNPGKYELTVELISYEPYTTEIDSYKKSKLNISLLAKINNGKKVKRGRVFRFLSLFFYLKLNPDTTHEYY